VDELPREAWMRKAVLCGVSARTLYWFRGGITDSFGGFEGLADGLGLRDTTA